MMKFSFAACSVLASVVCAKDSNDVAVEDVAGGKGGLRSLVREKAGIINGHVAEPGEYPFAASVQAHWGFHFCGGSLITKDVILSAAHCRCNAMRVSQEA